MDLEAIDIQRGRDHGLPGYNEYRRKCNLNYLSNFQQLRDHISEMVSNDIFSNFFNLNCILFLCVHQNVRKIESLYEHVDDVDLFVGGSLENKLPGSLLGPTFQCIIGEQFYRSRVGDKYFYNNKNFKHSFTKGIYERIMIE